MLILGPIFGALALYMRAAENQQLRWLAEGDRRASRYGPPQRMGAWKLILPSTVVLTTVAAPAFLLQLIAGREWLNWLGAVLGLPVAVRLAQLAMRRFPPHPDSIRFIRDQALQLRLDALRTRTGWVFWSIVVLTTILAASFVVIALTL
jgi:hypothetical protein